MNKLFLLSMLIILLLPVCYAAEEPPIILEPKKSCEEGKICTYNVLLKQGQPPIGTFKGTVKKFKSGETVKDGTIMLDGMFVSSYKNQGKDDQFEDQNVKMAGDMYVFSEKVKTGKKQYNDSVAFYVDNLRKSTLEMNSHKIEDADEDYFTEAALLVMENRQSWAEVFGLAKIIPPKGDGEIIIEDISLFFNLNQDEDVFSQEVHFDAIPSKETSSIDGQAIQSKKVIRVEVPPNGETAIYVNKGPAFIRNIIPSSVFVVDEKKKAKLHYTPFENKGEVLTVSSGVVSLQLWTSRESVDFSEDSKQEHSVVDILKRKDKWDEGEPSAYMVIDLSGDSLSGLSNAKKVDIKASIRDVEVQMPGEDKKRALPTDIVIHKDNFDTLDTVYVNKIDDSSRLDIERAGILRFDSRGVTTYPKTKNIFSFKTNFETKIASEEGSMLHDYGCYWEPKVCKLDGTELSSSYGRALEECETDSDCSTGFCAEYKNLKCEMEFSLASGPSSSDCNLVPQAKYCLADAECKEHPDISGSSDKGNILFIGEAFNSENELKWTINTLMADVLYKKKPFTKYKGLFSAEYLMLESLPSTASNAPLIGAARAYTDKCPGTDYVVVLSKKPKDYYRSHAIIGQAGTGGVAQVYLEGMAESGKLSEDDKLTFVHEFGHHFANLVDEYVELNPEKFAGGHPGYPNCATTEKEARKWWSEAGMSKQEIDDALNKYHGFKGCGGGCADLSICNGYFRPSYNSIMRKFYSPGGQDFNKASQYAIEQELKKL
ncbi:MAG: M64 family metallopeptidase [Candidatus Woesearchaeota archaeon]